MFKEPNPLRAVDKVVVRHGGCQNPARILYTPPKDIALVLSPQPRRYSATEGWIDPRFTAIYVIENEANDLCKIGYANSLKHRLGSLTGGSPVGLHVAHFVYVAGPPLAKWVEAEAHAILAEHRIKGEWFRVDVDTAAEAIAKPIIHRGLVWWSEECRRKLGYKAAALHSRDIERAA